MANYIFIDESGDPGQPFIKTETGEKIPTGASMSYILSAVCLDTEKLFILENSLTEIRTNYGFRSELKSNIVPLTLYADALHLVNDLEIPIYYRLVDKTTYRGVFSVDGNKKLHNVFDEYNLTKVAKFAVLKCNFKNVEIIIDRTDRRLLNGKFDNFNDYLRSKVNTKTEKRVEHITHVNSEYVNAMQLSDLINGAIKDNYTGKNKELIRLINKKYLYKIW